MYIRPLRTTTGGPDRPARRSLCASCQRILSQPHAHPARKLGTGSFPTSVRESERCRRLETRLNARITQGMASCRKRAGRTQSRRQVLAQDQLPTRCLGRGKDVSPIGQVRGWFDIRDNAAIKSFRRASRPDYYAERVGTCTDVALYTSTTSAILLAVRPTSPLYL